MKTPNSLWLMILALPGILLLSSCSSTDGSHSHVSGSVQQSVYGGYGYPYYGYGHYDDDYYDDRVEHIEERRKAGQERRQERRENRPSTQPLRQDQADSTAARTRLRDSGMLSRDRSRFRTSTGMGRPARSQMRMRAPRGGGLRRRR